MHIQSVIILGAGTMGRGIAQYFAQNKVSVTLLDINDDLLKKSQDLVFQSWDKLVEKKKFTSDEVTQFKNSFHTDLTEKELSSCDLFLEAASEKSEIKIQIFQEWQEKLPEKTVMASNTSSLSLNHIAGHLEQKRKKKFLGIHFFNPAPLMKLVELVKTDWIDSSILLEIKEWFEKHQKKICLCSDSPGFVVNRVARNFYGEAMHLTDYLENKNIDENVFKEIDQSLTEVLGFRMGPFQLMDFIGIDINYQVTQIVWEQHYYNPRFRPHKIQRNQVLKNELGRKSQKGFYSYE